MEEQIRKEMEIIEKSADKIKALAEGNNSLTRNADIIKTFIYIMKFACPVD
jgi:hypothetical protein